MNIALYLKIPDRYINYIYENPTSFDNIMLIKAFKNEPDTKCVRGNKIYYENVNCFISVMINMYIRIVERIYSPHGYQKAKNDFKYYYMMLTLDYTCGN